MTSAVAVSAATALVCFMKIFRIQRRNTQLWFKVIMRGFLLTNFSEKSIINLRRGGDDMKKRSQLTDRIVRPYLILLTVILSLAVAVVYSSFVSRLQYETETAGIKLAKTTAKQIDTFIEELDLLAEQVTIIADGFLLLR